MIDAILALALAVTPLPPAPSNGYCYDGWSVAGYNGVRNCPQPPPPAAGRIMTSNIAYVPATGSVRFTTVTEWSAIWGHATPFDAETPFPGRSNAQPTVMNFTRTGYIAAHFQPTLTGAKFGWLTHTEYNYGADLTWAISSAAGDFNPVNAICKGSATSGQTIGRWTTVPGTYRTYCPVSPGANYYLNVKLTDPTQSAFCPATSAQCAVGTANNFGG